MKVDKGFEWNYFNLSYRRKLIRTLWWGILIVCIPIVCIFVPGSRLDKAVICIAALILWSIQLLYNAIRFLKEK